MADIDGTSSNSDEFAESVKRRSAVSLIGRATSRFRLLRLPKIPLKLLIVALLLSLALEAGIYFYGSRPLEIKRTKDVLSGVSLVDNKPLITPKPLELEQSVAKSNKEGWAVYKDTALNLQFEYPVTWSIGTYDDAVMVSSEAIVVRGPKNDDGQGANLDKSGRFFVLLRSRPSKEEGVLSNYLYCKDANGYHTIERTATSLTGSYLSGRYPQVNIYDLKDATDSSSYQHSYATSDLVRPETPVLKIPEGLNGCDPAEVSRIVAVAGVHPIYSQAFYFLNVPLDQYKTLPEYSASQQILQSIKGIE